MVKLWSAFARCCVGHLDLEHDVRVCGGDGVCDAVAARRPWRADGEFQKWVCLLLLFNVVCVCVCGCLMIKAVCGLAMCIHILQLYINDLERVESRTSTLHAHTFVHSFIHSFIHT